MKRKRSEHQPDPETLDYEADSIIPIKTSIPKYLLYLLISIFSFGIYPLVLSWTKTAKYWVVFTTTDIDHASHILITTPDDVDVLCRLETITISNETCRYIDFRFVKYFYFVDTGIFRKHIFFYNNTLKNIKESEPLS